MSVDIPASIIAGFDTLLAVLIGLLLLRAVLTGLVPKSLRNPLWRLLCGVTAPPVWLVRKLSPHALPDGVMPLIAACWLWCARVALALFLGAAGPLPEVEITPGIPAASPANTAEQSP